MNIAQRILILLVRLYQKAVSPLLASLLGPSARCRFTPSCSQYAAEAVQAHGVGHGSWLAAKRLCRCHPWGGCGDDPVPDAVGVRPSSVAAAWSGQVTQVNSNAVGAGHAAATEDGRTPRAFELQTFSKV